MTLKRQSNASLSSLSFGCTDSRDSHCPFLLRGEITVSGMGWDISAAKTMSGLACSPTLVQCRAATVFDTLNSRIFP